MIRILTALTILAGTIMAGPVQPHRRQPLQSGGGAWYDTDYSNRISVTIDNAQVPSTLSNFPLYIDLSDLPSSFHSTILASGNDVRASNDTHVSGRDIDMVVVDTVAETGEAHILIPTVSSSVDTVIYLYYGYASASAYATPENVWDATGANYMGVWHMQAGGASAQPSATAIAALDADPTSLAAGASVAGKLGNGITYDGSADYHSIPSGDAATYLQPGATFSMSLWMAADDFANQVLFGNQLDSTSKGTGLWIWSSTFRPSLGGSGNPWTNLTEATAGKSASTFYHLAATHDGVTAKLYFDGVEVDTYAHTTANTFATQPCYFARRPDGDYFDGELDEIRITDDTLSADWISVEFLNQNTPTTLYTIGTEESQ